MNIITSMALLSTVTPLYLLILDPIVICIIVTDVPNSIPIRVFLTWVGCVWTVVLWDAWEDRHPKQKQDLIVDQVTTGKCLKPQVSHSVNYCMPSPLKSVLAWYLNVLLICYLVYDHISGVWRLTVRAYHLTGRAVTAEGQLCVGNSIQICVWATLPTIANKGQRTLCRCVGV